MKKIVTILVMIFAAALVGSACTSMIVSARSSASGRPLLWKHRDTGADNNFLQRVEPRDGSYGYVGLFNAGDSLLAEAWMGMNDAGFAIMNTASYNLAPDTAQLKDREGVVMSAALARCATVDEFERLLAEFPKPLGVQANFGVIDANGGAAYFETDDWHWTRFDVDSTKCGVLIRTNFSMTGRDDAGSGYIRYAAAQHLASEAISAGAVSPQLLTEDLSRSFYHGLMDFDFMSQGWRYVADRDFIPRNISTASIVIEGVTSADSADDIRMWAVLGYPPCGTVERVGLDSIPAGMQPDADWRSPACDEAMALRRSALPYEYGSGTAYLDLDVLRPIIEEMHRRSLEVYGAE